LRFSKNVKIMDAADRTFDVYLRRQFRFGRLRVLIDRVGIGYQPRALLHVDATGLGLIRVNRRGEPMEGTDLAPRSWKWRWDQILSAQTFVVTFGDWGIPPTRFGVRLDIHGESFYPLIATHTPDELMQALEDHVVAVDRKPRKLGWYLIGWN
jgi:hypothetical protein